MSNFFTRAFKGIINPSTYRGPQKLNGSIFYQIGTFFGYDYGAKELRKYLCAYGSNPLVYMIIRRIATTTAGIQRKVLDESGEQIPQSEIELIMSAPNSEQGDVEFLESCYEYLLATGNLFIKYTEGVGIGAEIVALNSSQIKIKLDNMGQPSGYVYTNNLGNDVPYELEDILHIKTSNVVDITDSGVYFGLSPLEAAWLTVKSSDEIFGAEAAIFKNRGIIGILTNETDTPMLTKERERLQGQFDSEVGGHDRYNSIKISNTKLKYIQTGMSPTDLKLLEGIMNKLRILCSVYGLSSVLFNDNDNSTYNNVESAEKASYNNVFIPLARKVLTEISIFLSDKLGVNERMVPDLTTIEAVKAATNAVAQALSNLSPQVQTRIVATMTRDEARELIELGVLSDTVLGGDLVGDGKADTNQQDTPNV